jgi:hypothetical protein
MPGPLAILFKATTRACILLGLLAAPLALMPTVRAGERVTIEQPAQADQGFGLMLVIALQRN